MGSFAKPKPKPIVNPLNIMNILDNHPIYGKKDPFYEEYNGYHILVIRQNAGFWCGYIGIDPNNLIYNCIDVADSDNIPEVFNFMHGGSTFGDDGIMTRLGNSYGNKETKWIGCDGAHGGDVLPMSELLSGVTNPLAVYRDREWFINHMSELRERIIAYKPPSILSTLGKDKNVDLVENFLTYNKLDDKLQPNEGYCMKCNLTRVISSLEHTVMKNGTPAIKGKCIVCGTGMYRVIRDDPKTM